MQIDREKVRNVFAGYVSKYNDKDTKIKLKIEHTYRVAENSERIAKSLSLSLEDVDLAWLNGMLHDIGRFEQIKRYGTFSDAASVDHALLGVKLLFEDGLLKDYLSENDLATEDTEILRTAISNHSAYKVDKNMSPRMRMFCDILRDADKVDIFRVTSEERLEDIYNFTAEEIYQSGVTPEVEQAFTEHHAILRSIKKQPADYLIANTALAFELVYKESIKIAFEQGYLKKLMEYPNFNPETRQIIDKLSLMLDEYLKSMI